MARPARSASPLVAALLALAATSLLAAPAQASSRDTARVEVRIEDPLGNPIDLRLVVVTVDDPASTIEARTDERGRVSLRVPVSAAGSTVTVDLSGAGVMGDPVHVFPGVVPRDRIDVAGAWPLLAGGFFREPQNEEFYDFDADGDGTDDALYRWPRDGLPDVLAVDIDADGVGVETDRVGAGDMALSLVDIDLDGADEVVLTGEGAGGAFTGAVWTYDPGTGAEDSFSIGGGGGWLYWSQLDGAADLDPWWVADPSACGAGPIERILSDGSREHIQFPVGARGFPRATDFDADGVGDLRCAAYTWSSGDMWTVWQWSSASGAIETFSAPGLSPALPFEVDCDADGVQETAIPGELVAGPEGPERIYRAYEYGGQTWESRVPEAALSVSLQAPGGACPVP